MKIKFIVIIICTIIGCSKPEEIKIPSADDRIAQAKSDLLNDLTEPTNGWELNYQPIPGAGIYYILLNFNEDGTVHVQSDVKGNQKDFYNDDITFRIDNRLSLELILETYGVFHYLFEQEASTFEAEFEFLFVEKSGDNLVFASKSDVTTEQTILIFTPASANAEDKFSTVAQENWQSYEEVSPQFLGASTAQQVVLLNQNISIFWNINFLERNLEVTVAAKGSTIEEISSNNVFVAINHFTGYTILNDKLILLTPFSFSFDGSSYTISEISLTIYSTSGGALCPSSGTGSPQYSGSISDIGPCVVNKTLYDYEGSFFIPYPDNPYSVNVLFVVNADGYSLSNSGSINEHFPTATGFAFNFGYLPQIEDPQEPSYAVGIYFEDDQGLIQHYLREFEMTTTIGNKIMVNLLDSYYFSSTPGANDQQNLESITDEIFAEGIVFASGVEAEDISVFRLFNPCNGYEVYLVQ